MDSERDKGKPTAAPPFTLGTVAIICALVALIVGGTVAIHSNPLPAELVAEAP